MSSTNWFDLTPLSLSVFHVTFPSKPPSHRIQSHGLLQTQPPLQPQTCNRHSLSPKKLKILDVSIHLSCHFSVRTHGKGTLQPKLVILTYLQDLHLSTTSNLNLSPTQPHNIKILLKATIKNR